MRRAAPLLLAFCLAGRALALAAATLKSARSENQPPKIERRASWSYSPHALRRMAERGVEKTAVERLLGGGESFRYYHDRRWKTGYYGPDSRLFVATVDGVVVTVMPNASSSYIRRLRRKKP